ncbi:PREDICTED: desiccation protectant protein Lea14 homolog isoform X1 [Lupinus angustifolius]|uniref:desiccation protectant protein Lea14 homolog isoform X1 n=1 Tax=Lupinus angustifolius TaxID=3871 RepID=UPI00092F55CD|nr:PREDICTED: desiccation protectant protein Lea14 homolog isoform X1 [Lupinus angustifolius]
MLSFIIHSHSIFLFNIHFILHSSTSSSSMEILDKAKNYVAEKVANAPKPEASITDVDFTRVGRAGAEYLAKVSVKNPYGTSIPICEIKYCLKSADREIASGTIPDPGSLKASDTTILDVSVKVPHSILVNLARDIGADWDIDYQLDISLIIDLPVIGNFTIPLSQKGEFKLPTFSDIFA